MSSAVGATAGKAATAAPTSAATEKAFANVFQKGGFAADWDDDWCPTRPRPWPPHGPLGGGLDFNTLPTQIR